MATRSHERENLLMDKAEELRIRRAPWTYCERLAQEAAEGEEIAVRVEVATDCAWSCEITLTDRRYSDSWHSHTVKTAGHVTAQTSVSETLMVFLRWRQEQMCVGPVMTSANGKVSEVADANTTATT